MTKDYTVKARIDKKQLERLQKILGLDESKTIRACMNCTEFVTHRLFGGELKYIFKRNKKDEDKELYQNP